MANGWGTGRWLVVAALAALGGGPVVLLILRRRAAPDGRPEYGDPAPGPCSAPLSADAAAEWSRHQGTDVIDPVGERIGTLHAVYVEGAGAPDWGIVNTGRLRVNLRFVPMRDAALVDGRVHLPFARDVVTSAPALDADAWITQDEEEALRAHYAERRNGAPGL
jgi:hypothetical protein